ncbi:serotonin receptor-like protein [Leptotrombidium deliense]|uniref:Serotonin receptor-like protein n=1 Tax=Leptotrombidium deliense TaxID=299467 RepID=A0A443ST20_9ACAR|nr:serotonin receptor-like protein [Leptotrombidium deliense]
MCVLKSVARKRIRNKPGNKMNAVHAKQDLNPKKTFNGKSVSVIETPNTESGQENTENLVLTERSQSPRHPNTTADTSTDPSLPACDSNFNKAFENEAIKTKRKETKKEHKTAKILAIITGIFIVCWLPFFINALIMPFCHSCQSEITSSIFLWLGYVNSLLNPVIYTIFSPDFRNAFRKMFGMRVTRR